MSVLDNAFKLPHYNMFALMTPNGRCHIRTESRVMGISNTHSTFRVSDPSSKIINLYMKNTTRNTRGLGAWVLGGMASLAMVASAFGQAAVTQATPITINDNAPATPSPSVIDLTKSNLLGSVEKVSVTLNNLAHSYANDVGVLLVYTNGATTKTVVLMNNAGGGQPVNGTLTLDASA